MSTRAATAASDETLARQRALRGIGASIAAAGLLGIALAAVLARFVALDPEYVWRVALLVLGGGAALAALAARHLRTGASGPKFGAANQVTLVRATLTLLLAGMLGFAPTEARGWTLVALATVAAVLDSVDGWLARRRGEASAFGARFDMETDALLILVLAALAWQLGKAGPWVLLAGLLRYLFVAAGQGLPWLARPLPPSRRRQAVCVVQIVTLIVCVAPPFVPPASGTIALAGLALLVWSFALDTVWLARSARG
jgi:phosphatidylglycerophosphate synthase